MAATTHLMYVVLQAHITHCTTCSMCLPHDVPVGSERVSQAQTIMVYYTEGFRTSELERLVRFLLDIFSTTLM